MKKLTIIWILLSLALCVNAQDFIFSQFHLSPLNLSPALTGSNCGERVNFNYRDQWTGEQNVAISGFRTASLSYDRPLFLGNGDKIGVGGRLALDEAGTVQLRKVLASLSFSYQKRISDEDAKGQYLIGGIDGGVSQYSIDLSGAVWPTTTGPIRENDLNPDLTFGLAYQYELDARNSIQIGGAVGHLIESDVSFFSTGSIGRTTRRYTGFALIDLPISPMLDVRPRVFYTNLGSNQVFIGTLGARITGYVHQFELGFGTQYVPDNINGFDQTSWLLYATYYFKNFGLSISRDFNTSGLNIPGLNTVEAAVIYRPCRERPTEPEE